MPSEDMATSTLESTIMANMPLGSGERSLSDQIVRESFLHMGNLPFITKEGSLTNYLSDVGLTTHITYHCAFLWSLGEHLPDVTRMIFHHGEVARMSVYKFPDWSMGGEGSFQLPTTLSLLLGLAYSLLGKKA